MPTAGLALAAAMWIIALMVEGRDGIHIATDDPRSPAGRLLIGMLSAELSARYPEGADGNSDYDIDTAAEQAGAVFVIAWAGAEPAGCGALRPREPGVVEIKRMFVRMQFRGRGIAGAILAALEKAAVAGGCHTIRLESGVRQPEANRVYARAGFTRIPCWGKYAECQLSVCYEKRL